MNQLLLILIMGLSINLIKKGHTQKIIEFTSETSSCLNADNSTNITISCTLQCEGLIHEEAKIKVFDTLDYSKLTEANLTKGGTICEKNKFGNATRTVSGTVSQELRNNDCFFSAECRNEDNSINEKKIFQYSDCGSCTVNQQCSPTAASTTTTPDPTSCSAVPSTITVSSNVTVTETTYSAYCPGSTTELNTTTFIPTTTTITASASSCLTTSATSNAEPNAMVSVPTSLLYSLCSNLAVSTVISTYTTTVTRFASTSTPGTISDIVTTEPWTNRTIAGLGAGSGTLILIIAVSVLINVAFCIKAVLYKRKSRTQDVPLPSFEILNRGFDKPQTFPPIPNQVDDSPAAPPTSNMK